ncbi:MAG: small ribosomal subunit biogenesis GTPase RsgA [Microcoleaceae cyanobacterium]
MSVTVQSDVNLNTINLVGTVIAVQAYFYQVRLGSVQADSKFNSASTHSTLLCTRRTRLKKLGQKVMVGDRVVVEEPDWADRRGAIAEVLPRSTELDRPPIANVTQVLLLFSVAEPDLDAYALSRFLVKAESTGLRVRLCLNKCELVEPETLEQWHKRLSHWGYQPIFLSVHQRTEYQLSLSGTSTITSELSQTLPKSLKLLQQLQQQTTVISVPSGVGKSSLINWLIPQIDLRVGAVSGKLGRGRHTTRHVELFELPTGGLLADSPGFNQHILECDPSVLVSYFPEARQRLAQATCQFSDCLHRDEPNCAVRGDWERYEHYLDFLEEVVNRQEALQQKPDAESNLKSKAKSGGHRQQEPKLEFKKYRRSSRRSEHQDLQNLYDEMVNTEEVIDEV